MRPVLFLLLAALGSACSMPSRVDGDGESLQFRPGGARGAGLQQMQPGEARALVHSELIQSMLVQRQYYAALAHIQERRNESGDSAELRYLEAEARRELGQGQRAEELYRGLLRSEDYAGQAYHGLGLLYASKSDYENAVQHLRSAAQRRPTDGQVRNDLGYALMMAGRYPEALPEIATAVELDANDKRSRNNLVLLLMLTNDEAGVKRVASESGLSKETLAGLRQQAQSLKKRRAAAQGKGR